MRQALLKRIIGWDPKSVFEFGCGRGANLRILRQLGIIGWGIDINEDEVAHAHTEFGLREVQVGDESKIDDYVKDAFEVSFTCGVLDHIPEEDFYNVLSSLEKVTSEYMYCLETNDRPNQFFYPHDYQAADFVKLKEFQTKNGLYVLWGKCC